MNEGPTKLVHDGKARIRVLGKPKYFNRVKWMWEDGNKDLMSIRRILWMSEHKNKTGQKWKHVKNLIRRALKEFEATL